MENTQFLCDSASEDSLIKYPILQCSASLGNSVEFYLTYESGSTPLIHESGFLPKSTVLYIIIIIYAQYVAHVFPI